MVAWNGVGAGDYAGIFLRRLDEFGRVYQRPSNVFRSGFESDGSVCMR